MLDIASVEPSTEGAKAFLQRSKYDLLIGGDWVAASGGEYFETIDPANGNVIGNLARANAADVDKAVAAARKAFSSGAWPPAGFLTQEIQL